MYKIHILVLEMLRRAITDLFCFGAKSRGVCLFVCSFVCLSVCQFLGHIRKLNSNSQHQEVVIHYIFKENLNLHILVFECISLTK